MTAAEIVGQPRHRPARTSGEALLELRKKRGMSQRQLATSTGIGQATLSAMENGRVAIGPERARKLAVALGVHPAVLVFPDLPGPAMPAPPEPVTAALAPVVVHPKTKEKGAKGGKPRSALSQLCDELQVRVEEATAGVLDAHLEDLLPDSPLSSPVFARDIRAALFVLAHESAVTFASESRKFLGRRIKNAPGFFESDSLREQKAELRKACEWLCLAPPRWGKPVDEDLVRKAFKALAKDSHPDGHFGEAKEAKEALFKIYSAAAARIRQYNAELAASKEPEGADV